jgi:signal transduction histidine kinase
MSSESVAGVRHQLRTALNHILGYSEMLLEESVGIEPAVQKELAAIRDSARLIHDAINLHLPASTRDPNLDRLREALADPVAAIVRSVGSLTQTMESVHLLDLLRINLAAGELLAFAEGATKIDGGMPRSLRPAGKRAAPTPGYLLVVDDNEANRDMLYRQLERQGHKVETAEDGRDALRQIAAKPYDLVLLDVLMPDMDGYAVLESLKTQQNTRNLAVIMVSALDQLDHVAECLEAGADDYLMKPFEPVLLQARITASLERKRLRDREQERSRELERANQELQQFAYVASHDLQEPLRTMGVYAQLLTRRWHDRLDAESEQYLLFITDAAKRMRSLVEDVLALSRTTRNEERSLERVDLNEVLEHVMSDLQVAIDESGASVTGDRLPAVMGDSAEMAQLFSNLFGNAIKYRRPDAAPDIRVSAARDGSAWIVSVADNGLGISPDQAEQVFLPFKRLHGRDIPGSGIGLALCRRIVEQHGGRIWVEPREGGGSVFRFSIPTAD